MNGKNNKDFKYEFISCGNRKIDEVIIQFDKQIKKEYLNADGQKELCSSYWKKLLFINSIDLDISDWKKIRDEEYWVNTIELIGIEKDKYKLEKILNYNKTNK
jgi:hypothetical protein